MQPQVLIPTKSGYHLWIAPNHITALPPVTGCEPAERPLHPDAAAAAVGALPAQGGPFRRQPRPLRGTPGAQFNRKI